jgi:uncharacterized protein (UPF0332 family)
MAIEPVRFYEFASTLYLEAKDDEAAQRTVVSRAYYSAFLAARARAGITVKGGRVHEAVIEHFHERKDYRLANGLGDLRRQRNQADYDLHLRVTSLQAGAALKQARALLERLQVLPQPAPPQLGDSP